MASILSAISLSEIKESNSRINDATAPHTALFVGATAGIGRATLELLVARGTPVKVYVVGRSTTKSQPLVDQLRTSNAKAEIIFIEAQVSLMSEVKRICDEIKSNEKSLDALFMAAGHLPFGGREETSEGLEVTQALQYYGRMLFTTLLLPLLNASTRNPRIISILAAGFETASIWLDDLDLRQPSHFGVVSSAYAWATYTTLALSRVARENPRLVVIHNHPGQVATDIIYQGWKSRTWLRWAFTTFMWPFVKLMAISPADSGQRSLYLLTSARYGGTGVGLKAGATLGKARGLTMEGTEEGALFCVDAQLKCLRQENIMAALEAKGAGPKLWARLEEVMAPYV